MRLWSLKIASAGALCFASFANAADNPYGAPAALPRPAASTRVSPYWTQYASHTDGAPEGVHAVDETVVQGHSSAGAPAAAYGQPTLAGGGSGASGNCGNGGYGDSVYGGASPYESAVSGCGDYDFGGASCMHFYASVAGLVMTRGPGNRVYTTHQDSNVNNQLMHTQDAAMNDWRGGFQLTAGYRFGCACEWGIEATYWMLDQFNGSSSITRANDLSSPLDSGFVNFPGPQVASDIFDQASTHTIQRSSNFLNLELNLLRFPICCGDNFQLTWLAGVRWFRFNENMLFSSYQAVPVNGNSSAHLNVRTENDLVGFQLGARCSYAFTPSFKVFANPTVGLYANTMDVYANIYNNLGQNGVTNPPAPGQAQNFPVSGSKTDVAIMSSIDIGMEYQISCHWKVFGGYRIVAASGVALTDQQIPHFLNDTPEWQNVESNGNLILHGAFAGVEFRF